MVVAIIAILSSVFLIGLRGFRGSAYDARRLSDLQKVQSYLELYYNKARTYPDKASYEELMKDDAFLSAIGISALPDDPISGAHYLYAVDIDGQSYILGAILSDPNAAALDESQEIDTLPPGFSGIDCADDETPAYCIHF